MNKKPVHTPEGVRDIYGKEYAVKLAIEEHIHGQLNSYGYEDIQTPTFEFFDVFSKDIGTTPSRELYKFLTRRVIPLSLDQISHLPWHAVLPNIILMKMYRSVSVI